jgi:hypothetical protein
MIGLVAFNLILRIVGTRVMRIAFVICVACMNLDDAAADMTGLGIPGDVIADFEALAHHVTPATIVRSSAYQPAQPFAILSWPRDFATIPNHTVWEV